MIPHHLFITGRNGALGPSHVVDTPGGEARPLTDADLAAIFPGFQGSLLASIADLETTLAAKVARIAELEAALAAGIAELETLTARIAVLTKPPTPATLAFRALPAEIQEAFEDSYAIAALLVDAGRPDLARAHIAALSVPAELEETRQGILALIV